ncbi:MAG: hypothetical protein KBA46_04210 [Candidatus Omnitrophica bacterium]|nr:hypothetical protein [Candidatus Omnitrophota bacterium]
MKKILIAVVVLLVVLVVGKNIIAQAIVVNGIKAITGLNVGLAGINVSALNTSIRLNNLKIFNPQGFQDRTLVHLPEIYVDYRLRNLTHLSELRIHIKELMVVKNAQNQVNIQSLKTLLPKGEGKPPEIKIDLLDLKIDKVIYKDYAQAEPSVREFEVNYHEKFRNIDSPQSLVSLILVKAFLKTNVPSLANLDINALKQDISSAIKQEADSLIQQLKENIGGVLNNN